MNTPIITPPPKRITLEEELLEEELVVEEYYKGPATYRMFQLTTDRVQSVHIDGLETPDQKYWKIRQEHIGGADALRTLYERAIAEPRFSKSKVDEIKAEIIRDQIMKREGDKKQ